MSDPACIGGRPHIVHDVKVQGATGLYDVQVFPSPRPFNNTPIWQTLIRTNRVFIAPFGRQKPCGRPGTTHRRVSSSYASSSAGAGRHITGASRCMQGPPIPATRY
jgi:hypothetical protein